jgi:hypothetical protein
MGRDLAVEGGNRSVAAGSWRGHMLNTRAARMAAPRAPPLRTAGADSHAEFRVRATPLQGRLNGNGREFEDFLVLQVGVGSAVSASLARQIENGSRELVSPRVNVISLAQW